MDFCRNFLCLGFGLFENTQNLCFKFPKFHGEHRAPRMKNQVAAFREHLCVAAQSFSHAALDAIALMRFAENFASSEPDPGCFAGICGIMQGKKPAH